MHKPLQQGTIITVQHLPAEVVALLDEKFGKLLANNGGFAEWLLKIDHGQIRYIDTKEREFLEPNEARKLPLQ